MNEEIVEIIKKFPEYLHTQPAEIKVSASEAKSVVYCGMGGSGISGSIFLDVFPEMRDKFSVVKDYAIPNLKKDALVICVSYSGNTEETLSCFKQAVKQGCKVIGIAGGGKLLQWCQEQGVDYVKIDTSSGMPPRTAFPIIFSSLMHCLEKAGFAKADFSFTMDVPSITAKAEGIAKELHGFVPDIYCHGYQGTAQRCKDDLNEYGKVPAIVNIFPEVNHNDVEAWEGKMRDKVKVVLLRNSDEPKRIKERIEATKKSLGSRVGVVEVNMEGASRLERALSTVLLFQLVAVGLATLDGVETAPNHFIDEVKAELAKLPFDYE